MGISEADKRKIELYSKTIMKNHEPVICGMLFYKIGTQKLNLHFCEWDYDRSKFIEHPPELTDAKTYLNREQGDKRLFLKTKRKGEGMIDMPIVVFDGDGIGYLGRHRFFFTYPA